MDTDPTIILLCLAEYQKQEIPVQQNKIIFDYLDLPMLEERFLKEKRFLFIPESEKRGTRSGTVS